MSNNVSRRAFFRQAVAAPIATTAGVNEALPKQAWIILEVNWGFNDEFTYEEGERALRTLYYTKEHAEQECQRLCDAFFAAETPQQFEVRFELYEDAFPAGTSEESVTWEQLRQAGFPNPYSVQELQA